MPGSSLSYGMPQASQRQPIPIPARVSQSQDGANNSSYGGGGGGSYGTLSTDVDVRQVGVVRATQDYLWSQTQGFGGGGGKPGGRAAGWVGNRTNYVSFPSQTQSKMVGGSRAYGEGLAAIKAWRFVAESQRVV